MNFTKMFVILIAVILLVGIITSCSKSSSVSQNSIDSDQAKKVSVEWLMALKNKSTNSMAKLSSPHFLRVEEEWGGERGQSCGHVRKAKGDVASLQRELKCFTDYSGLVEGLGYEETESTLKSLAHEIDPKVAKKRSLWSGKYSSLSSIKDEFRLIEIASEMGNAGINSNMGEYYSLLFVITKEKDNHVVRAVIMNAELDQDQNEM